MRWRLTRIESYVLTHTLGGVAAAISQIVRAQQDDQMGRAGLRDHVAIEAPQAAVRVRVVMQDAVAANALIHDAGEGRAARGDETPRELIGPAAIGVRRGHIGVGEGIA